MARTPDIRAAVVLRWPVLHRLVLELSRKTSRNRKTSPNRLSQRILGERLRQCRKFKRLTLRQLGDLIGKSPATVSKIESGQQSLDLATFLAILQKLSVSPWKFLLDAQLADNPSELQREVILVLRNLVDKLVAPTATDDALPS